MLLRFPFLLLLYNVLCDQIDNVILTQSCADIIRPSQNYTPADSTLTIGTVPTFSYQQCGRKCRVTTLCRTAVWCQGQCTMYQEYMAFGIRSPDLNCMLITLSGIAFNEIEPTITIVNNVVYKESQSQYHEQIYKVNSVEECIQLCRLDSHCLTASYQTSTNYCSLFAEHVSQGRNYTDLDWTTIILDTCAGRDPRIYPCFIDATQADRTLCDLFYQSQSIQLNLPDVFSEPSGYTGWLTKSSVYWPININGEGAVFRASYDLKKIDPLILGHELEQINEKYLHISIDQRSQISVLYRSSKPPTSHSIHQIRLTDQKMTPVDFLSNVRIGQGCQWCYFAISSSGSIYVSMDNMNTIERYDMNGQRTAFIYIPTPSGIIIRNDDLWTVNNSQLIILSARLLPDQTLTYLIENQIDLSSLVNLPLTSPFIPFHLAVDNYGRVYIVGALVDIWSGNDRNLPGNNPQLYILADDEQGVLSTVCAGPWGMFGVNVYHSKLRLRMLTSMNDFFFHLYSNP